MGLLSLPSGWVNGRRRLRVAFLALALGLLLVGVGVTAGAPAAHAGSSPRQPHSAVRRGPSTPSRALSAQGTPLSALGPGHSERAHWLDNRTPRFSDEQRNETLESTNWAGLI